MSRSRSKQLFLRAQKLFPGGVNSPVRAFGAVGGSPVFFQKAQGPYLIDEDGNSYIDYVSSWGPMILGHAHPKVLEAIMATAQNGTSFGAPCRLEIELAKKLCARVPSLEQIRMVNSGTEALLSVLRLARGYTGRNKIIKFEGCYHGHADYLLVKAGSGALTHGHPNSLGVPKEFAAHTLLAAYNDLSGVKKLVKRHGRDLAAIVVEPIAGNMGLVMPVPGFLQGLKKLCRQVGALLIFDEVMTGLRVDQGGAQTLYKIRPDLSAFGKVLGGGLPVGAFGGPKKIMKCLAPDGGVYQAGTLSGNPVAMAAGLATLKALSSRSLYSRLARKTQRLAQGLEEAARLAGVPVRVPNVCGMLSIFFTSKKIENLKNVTDSRTDLYAKFFWEMLERGIYLPPSAYEAWFPSLAHGENEIAKTLRAAEVSFLKLKRFL